MTDCDLLADLGLGPEMTNQFYQNELHALVSESNVSYSHGAKMMQALRDELAHADAEPAEYVSALQGMYKLVMDGMMSAVHRGGPYIHVESSVTGLHIAHDDEEILMSGVIVDSDEEEEEPDTGSDIADDMLLKKPLSSNKDNGIAPQQQQDARTKKKEDQRKRRAEEEMMLVKDKKVRDDKGNILNSVGPFLAPRLTLRAAKSNQVFPSRKALSQRIHLDQLQQSSDDEEDVQPSAQGPSNEADAVAHLTGFMKPLSGDSLKKMSESAKVKIKPSSSTDDWVAHIVKTAVRLGCEKACVLMDKHKIIDAVTTHVQTSPLPTAASIDFLNSLPDDLKTSLGPVLGLPKNNASVVEMWERMVAMGFLSVLTNLRLGPLKKIAQELNVSLPDTSSTEKYCEAIVFSAFPGERLRVKNSKAKKQTSVTFSVPPTLMRCVGDMGFVTFLIQNVSTMRKDNERHYSPEFDYGNLKWSLLCMANKECLALYLCQTGTVYCKFVITVVNAHADDSICNEGTQKFSSASTENDWGFNSVIKFDTLLDPKNGFWSSENDSIVIEVGIVFVEAPKQPAPVVKQPVAPKEKGAGKNEPRIHEDIAAQLLEAERMENVRKKIKQDTNKTIKEEERTRKEMQQKAIRSLMDVNDTFKAERVRIVRDAAEKERREQQERAREQERLRQALEQNNEMKKKIADLTDETSDIANRKKTVQADIRDAKKATEQAKVELAEVEDQLAQLQQTTNYQEKQLSDARKRLEELELELEAESPPLSESEEEEPEEAVTSIPVVSATTANDDNEMMNRLRQSLAGILGN